MRAKTILYAFVAMLGVWLAPHTFAAAQSSDFTVRALLPSNQMDRTGGYFDLLVKPNQKQTVYAELTNSAKQAASFEVGVNPAMTSDNGAIDYGQSTRKVDASAPLDFRKVATTPKRTYTVAAASTIKIPITITMPAKQFKGRVLGGLHVLKKTKQVKGKINNRIAYSLAIVLQQSDASVSPTLALLKAGPKAVNHRTTIQLKFRNSAATIIPNLKFHTKITHNNKAFIDNYANPYQVAPNTVFNLNLGLDDHRVEPGTYKVTTVATNGKFYKRTFKTTFTVDAKQAAKINRSTITQPTPTNPWRTAAIVLGIVVALGACGGLAWWWWRKRVRG